MESQQLASISESSSALFEDESDESQASSSSDEASPVGDLLPSKSKTSGSRPVQPNGLKITIGNIDYRQDVHHMTQEHQTIDNHYLTVAVTKNRVHGNHLSPLQGNDQLKSMENGKYIPSHLEQIAQRENYIQLVERALVKNIPCLEAFKDVVVTHIPHMYSRETREPTESVSTGTAFLISQVLIVD